MKICTVKQGEIFVVKGDGNGAISRVWPFKYDLIQATFQKETREISWNDTGAEIGNNVHYEIVLRVTKWNINNK